MTREIGPNLKAAIDNIISMCRATANTVNSLSPGDEIRKAFGIDFTKDYYAETLTTEKEILKDKDLIHSRTYSLGYSTTEKEILKDKDPCIRLYNIQTPSRASTGTIDRLKDEILRSFRKSPAYGKVHTILCDLKAEITVFIGKDTIGYTISSIRTFNRICLTGLTKYRYLVKCLYFRNAHDSMISYILDVINDRGYKL